MTDTSLAARATNRILAENHDLLDLVLSENIDDLLEELQYDWSTNRINAAAQFAIPLRKFGFIDIATDPATLNRMGRLFVGRLLLHFDTEKMGDEVFGSLNEKYKDFRTISSGKNSIVVEARHRLLNTKVVLKLVRPGASSNITESLRVLSSIHSDSAIVLPIDFIEFRATDMLSKPVDVPCVVFPFVDGITFSEFLVQQNHHLNSQVVMSFARQVGGALRELEKIHAYHGDLHERNILVDQFAKGGVRFRIVDISFDAMGSLPFEECRNNDLANFKQHLWRILCVQKQVMPRMSIRKYIGTRNYFRIIDVLSERTISFAAVCESLANEVRFEQYINDKALFIADKFQSPVSFRLQRYEEITDQTIAVRLFVPFEPLMNKITGFSNVYVSGNRGSGKSTYLASLAFFPRAEYSVVDVRETFGIYFPCRQGEFRPLSARPGWAAGEERALVTNLLVIKIVRRTLEILSGGIDAGKLAYPSSLQRLHEFISNFVPMPGLVSVDPEIQSELENFVSTMVRVEMEEIDRLSLRERGGIALKNERTLLEFFMLVRETFLELAATRFNLLFDDAGAPYVPANVQRVICDFILTSNAVFCIKLSAEKLTFEFENSDSKILENGQDYFEHDISQMLFIGSGSGGLNRSILEEYFQKIVEQRLSHFSFKSTSITDYLGDNQLSVDRLIKLLALGRKDAYFCGWTTVWNIADRTPRNLLEIVSEIFTVGGIDKSTEPKLVSMRNQDRAIRTISEKRLESLSQISGSIEVRGKVISLGRHLFVTSVTVGSTFRQYLKSEAKRQRPRQTLAIERNDLRDISREAEVVLKRLVTFGILDSGKAGFARDDEIKKPFYVLNRIYCPAFGIAYRRDDHLRLSTGKLELLLLDPQKFMREGTRRLREAEATESNDLFGYGDLDE